MYEIKGFPNKENARSCKKIKDYNSKSYKRREIIMMQIIDKENKKNEILIKDLKL